LAGILGGAGAGNEPGTEHYATLGLPSTPPPSTEAIKAAYKKLSRLHHPDRSGGNKAQFQKISEAAKILLDEDLRDAYDKGGDEAVESKRQELYAPIEVLLSVALEDVLTGLTIKRVKFQRRVRKTLGSQSVTVPEVSEVEVVIPRGAPSGLRLTQANVGNYDKGPLVVVLDVAKASACGGFRRRNLSDLGVVVDVPLWKALLGGGCVTVAPVPGHHHLNGGLPVQVKIPSPQASESCVLHHGREFEVPGLGLPMFCPAEIRDVVSSGPEWGALVVVCNVVFPPSLPVGIGYSVAQLLGGEVGDMEVAPTHALELTAVNAATCKERQDTIMERLREHEDATRTSQANPHFQAVDCSQQ
jgi:DnaJ-class molecular chaperone